ncbi:MAG: agmatinase family protein [Acidobacteriia bacterium]|nr:agmatinase family protein [Terriglobia bacterium]
MTQKSFDPNAGAIPSSGIYGLSCTLDESKVVLLPVPVEITTSYGEGTALGPAAILQASKQVDLFDVSAGRVYEAGIHMMPESRRIQRLNREGRRLARPIIRRGGIDEGSTKWKRILGRVNAISSEVNEWVYAAATRLISKDKVVGVVGGDHSAPFGLMRAYAERSPGLGVLHFDAHCDLRIAYEGFTWSHASIMYNVVSRIPQIKKLVQVGIRDFCEQEMEIVQKSRGRILLYCDEDLQWQKFKGRSWKSIVTGIIAGLPRNVYVSFDIDGLNPSLCPHTGTPVPGGLSFEEAVYIIAAVSKSGRRIVGFDLNEVAPGPEGDEWDANVGARLLYKMIGHTLLSQKNSGK